jgi:hypothetical protein
VVTGGGRGRRGGGGQCRLMRGGRHEVGVDKDDATVVADLTEEDA